jgi:hypothetical protein
MLDTMAISAAPASWPAVTEPAAGAVESHADAMGCESIIMCNCAK